MKCTRLKLMRVARGLTQDEAAQLLNYSRSTYQEVENGSRKGSHEFWACVQRAFNISNADMWDVINNKEIDRL